MKLFREMLRLYAVTDRAWTGQKTLLEQTEEAIRGGATCIQLREKNMGQEELLKAAQEMRALCHGYGVPLIINDYVGIALKSGADGVHVGNDDMNVREIRQYAGKDFIIGATAKTIDQAVRAERDGADYLGSGAVFGSTTKLNAKPMSSELLCDICQSVAIPVVAIGGICRENIHKLRGSGICGCAVVSGIFSKDNIEEACRILRSSIEEIISR